MDQSARLSRLAILYLGMAHRSDDFLSDAELESVTSCLLARSGEGDRAAVQAIVMDELERFAAPDDAAAAVRRAARALHDELSMKERREILDDLTQVAQVGGVVLEHEHGMLRTLARIWGLADTSDAVEEGAERRSVLHDLAYVYLVLAHSTDHDLRETEMQVMLNKLREWQPDAPVDDVRRVLSLAMDEYAEGQNEERLEAAISSVRAALPHEQRKAALNDLVKIANADGVFLDNEEDLINHLQTEWDVDPSANYEPHDDKSVDGSTG